MCWLVESDSEPGTGGFIFDDFRQAYLHIALWR